MKSYNTLNDYYRKLLGEKTFKVPIDAGFDCPNHDGTVAHGGCTFLYSFRFWRCHRGPGCYRGNFIERLTLYRKWPDVQEVPGYFQNLPTPLKGGGDSRERYEQAINEPGVVGRLISVHDQTVLPMKPSNI